ncbi:MAG: hypothetical protein JNK76_16690 [Planctomycetales bacterium]|nr:hypothetical protein [Planctomycetales bacterium]MBN8628845.1 hypothetical protein [Planctomycetota bacterium]
MFYYRLLPAIVIALGCATSLVAEELATSHGKPAYEVVAGEMRVVVTKTGGHMTATFPMGKDRPAVAPYYVSPWQGEAGQVEPPLLSVLRGDFFCLPFGGNAEAYNGEQHPPHGETANTEWQLLDRQTSGERSRLVLAVDTKVRKGRVTKELTLAAGEPVVYSTHIIEGFAGPAPLGHHATLRMPEKEGAMLVSTSPFKIGLTNPTQFSNPANKEYQSLAINARFDDLARVPQIFKDAPDADCTKFPTRQGYADLLCVVNEAAAEGKPAWVAAVNTEENYLWFALKDPAVLPSLLFWIENHGRHGAPWNGRNNCLGLEDLCTNFADGLAPSVRENALTKLGVPTVINLTAERLTSIHYIQGCVPTPAGFGKVERVEFGDRRATFVDAGGKRVEVPVRYEFLKSGKF